AAAARPAARSTAPAAPPAVARLGAAPQPPRTGDPVPRRRRSHRRYRLRAPARADRRPGNAPPRPARRRYPARAADAAPTPDRPARGPVGAGARYSWIEAAASHGRASVAAVLLRLGSRT